MLLKRKIAKQQLMETCTMRNWKAKITHTVYDTFREENVYLVILIVRRTSIKILFSDINS